MQIVSTYSRLYIDEEGVFTDESLQEKSKPFIIARTKRLVIFTFLIFG
jgi:hypothetical protein